MGMKMSEKTRNVGVSFSGGGIRSAALSSGVLRRLLQKNVSFNYLSCVSGGGYCGASYLQWKYHHGKQDNALWHEQFFNNMRQNCGVICDWQNLSRGFCDMIILISLLFFIIIIIPTLNILSPSLFIAFIVDYFIGDTLRQGFVCPDPETKSFKNAEKNAENRILINLTVENFLKQTKTIECVPVNGLGLLATYKLFTISAAGIVLFYILTVLSSPKGMLKSKAKFLLYVFFFIFAFTFTPWLLEEYISVISSVTSIGCFILGIIIWIVLPFLRNKTLVVLLIYVYSYIIKWRVYKTTTLTIDYHEHWFHIGLCCCAFLLWLNPFLSSLQRIAIQSYNRWKLQRAFFCPEHIGAFGCSGIALKDCFPTFALLDVENETSGLHFSDLNDITPKYICNLLIGNWIKHPENEECESYSILTITPDIIERIDCLPNEETFKGRLNPSDVKLSDMMATSAAAVSSNMGVHHNILSDVRDIQIILGINMEKSIITRDSKTTSTYFICLQCILPLLVQCVIITPVILLPIAISWEIEAWINTLVALTLFIVAFIFFVGIQPTGRQGFQDQLIRWCVRNIEQVRFIRAIFNVFNYGEFPPPILTLSDGGHVENLGLLPLLKRRCERILVVDGGFWHSDQTIAQDLLHAVDLARKWLRCSFSGPDGRDIVEDIKSQFINKSPGYQPRVYTFKVEYYEIDDKHGNDIKTGEGLIRIVYPRHPSYGVETNEQSSWQEYAQDTGFDIDVNLWAGFISHTRTT